MKKTVILIGLFVVLTVQAQARSVDLGADLVLNPCEIHQGAAFCVVGDPAPRKITVELSKAYATPTHQTWEGKWEETREALGAKIHTVILISETVSLSEGPSHFEMDVIIEFPKSERVYSVTTQFEGLIQMNPLELRSYVVEKGTEGVYPIFYVWPIM
ncbi:MAG: hypothetical protein AABZ55_02710 [Bdellovibrionota bacterium]